MEENLNAENQETQETQENCNTTSINNSPGEQSPELKGALDLLKESNAKIVALNNEIAILKQANAKLAIQQSISAPTKEAEDIINDMFK